MKSIKKTDTEKIGASLLQKAKMFAWETGLSPLINIRPDILGQQAVLYFPGKGEKHSYPCCEHNNKMLLALTENEMEEIRESLLQNPAVELWLKKGWFSGTVRLLDPEEKNELMESIPDSQFFGYLFRSFIKPSLKDHYLLEATRSAPCTGSSGPGSKAWIWPLAAILLLFAKKKK